MEVKTSFLQQANGKKNSHNTAEAEASVLTDAIIYNPSVTKQIFDAKFIKKSNHSFRLNHTKEPRTGLC